MGGRAMTSSPWSEALLQRRGRSLLSVIASIGMVAALSGTACTEESISAVCSVNCGTGGTGGSPPAGPACPLLTGDRPRVVKLSVYHQLVMAILSDGRVLCWGEDPSQACGGSFYLEPRFAAAQACVESADLGFPMTVGLTWDRRVVVWGYEADNSAGDGPGLGPEKGEWLAVPLPTSDPVIAAVSGIPNAALTGRGEVYLWGDVKLTAQTRVVIDQPWQLDLPAPIAKLGEEAHCLLTTGREVYCFGSNTRGHLGLPSTEAGQVDPVKIDLVGSVALSESDEHACVITSGDEVWCWGTNSRGTMGQPWPEVEWHPEPVKVEGIPPATAIFAGDDGSCALDEQGQAWCWSADPATFDMEALPPAIWHPEWRFRDIGIGFGFACGLLDNGQVWCEGFGTVFGEGCNAGCFMDIDSAIDDPAGHGWEGE